MTSIPFLPPSSTESRVRHDYPSSRNNFIRSVGICLRSLSPTVTLPVDPRLSLRNHPSHSCIASISPGSCVDVDLVSLFRSSSLSLSLGSGTHSLSLVLPRHSLSQAGVFLIRSPSPQAPRRPWTTSPKYH
jgi:hypothetical protein